MKKRLLMFFLAAFIMSCLLSGGAALAATFGFNTEDLGADNTISETNSGETLQITSSAATDSVSNYTCQVGLGDWLSYQANPSLIDNFVVYIGDLTDSVDGDGKPNGTITVSLGSGKAFILKSFVCANESFVDTLIISNGTDSEDYSLPAGTNTLIEPSNKFAGITNFTISWVNDNHMNFDNFVIELITNPIITTQPSAAPVAGGGNTSFSVAALGNTLSYQWQVDTTGLGDSFSNITDGGVYTGAASASLSIAGVTAGMNDYLYRCVVTNDGTYSTTSDSVALSILGQAPTDIALNNASIDENTASGTKVGGFTTTDPDSSSFTYSLVDTGTYHDNASFTISGSDLLLNTVPNYEDKASYSICIQTQDETGLTYTETFSIAITDVNEAPTDISLSSTSIAENSASGTTIGTLSGTDLDLPMDVLTYSLPEGMGDNACFSLAENILKLAVVPDFEAKSSYSITARVSDGTLHYDKTFTISITNINETPTGMNISSSSALEHSYVGTVIGTFSGIDPDAGSTFTYSLAAGEGDTDNGSFTINANELKLGFIPDFETKDSYSIRVRVSDGSLTYDKQFTVTILDGNDPPTDITITGGSIAEDAAPGTTVGPLEATDPNAGDTFTYSLASGTGDTDNTCFSLSDSTLKLNTSLDYEVKNSYSVRIRTIDNHGFLYEKALTITVTNVNEAPTDMALSNNTIAEKSAIGATIGTLSGTDPDAGSSLTFSLPAGSGDNASFTISGTSLKLAIVPDFETKNTYSIFARVSDGSFTFDKTFTISITDADEAPTDIALSSSSVLEHCAVGTAIGLLTSDDQEGGAFTYSLVAGVGSTDNTSFSIAGNTLEAAVSLDFEMKDSLSVRIRTTDSTGLYYEKIFTIDVINGDDPPTDISLTNKSIAENSAGGSVIGILSSTDISGPGPFTYTFAVGSGDMDNAGFTIDEGALKIIAAPNYEVKSGYNIRIRTTNDSTGFYYEKAFTITITDVNEAPTGINLSSATINEHISSIVGTISGIDPDAGSTFTYELAAGVGDADNAKFTISGNELKMNEEADYEIRPTYNIRIRVTDNSSRTYEKDFIIIVINGNDPPTDIYLSALSIDENTPAATLIASMGCIDINGGSFTYSLVSGEGSTDNDKFAILDSTLRLAVVPDYETQSSYSIRTRVTDTGGLYYEKAFTIAVINVNEAPTDISLSGASIAENSTSGTTVGTLSGTDQDAGDTLTFTLAAGDGDTDNSAFTISGDKLMLAAVPDYETQNSYKIRVRVSDGTLSYEKAFTIEITNVNDAPTEINLSGSSILEHSAVGTAIGTLSAVDPDAGSTFTYSLAAGEGDTDNGSFIVDANTLKLGVVPDFETKDSYSIRVRVSDGSLSYDRQFTITITNGNDPPTDISITGGSVPENAAPGSSAGTLVASDPNSADTFTFSLADGTGDTDNASFSITGNVLTLDASADYEAKNSYSVYIRATDNSGLFYEKALVISVTNVNEAPTDISLSNNAISENSAIGTIIGTLSGTDPDAGTTFSYSLAAGIGDTDNGSFTLNDNELKLGFIPDFEARDSYSIRVRVSDGDLTYEEVFTITITDADYAPTNITLSSSDILEQCTIGTTVGTLSTEDQEGGVFTYSLVTGVGDNDNVSFSIMGDELKLAVVPDYEVKNSYDVRIRTTDDTGLYYEKAFTITITNVNEAPTNIALSNNVVPENRQSGTVIGTLSGTDPDAGSVFTYSLVSGTGAKDNASFMITGSTLKSASVFSYKTKNSYSIRIRITDEGGLRYEKQFTISVAKPVPVPVKSIAVSGKGGATSVSAGKTLQMLAVISPANATDKSVKWTISSGSGATISAGGLLTAKTAGPVTVRATANDGSGVYGERTITITAAPIAFVAVTGISGVPATATAGTQVTLTCIVAPANATNKTISWSIRDAGTTGATISGNKLSATAAGTVTVRATIANGLTESTPYIQDFSITVSAAPDTDDGDGSNTPTTQTPVYKADVESGTGSDTTLPITVDKDSSNAGVEVGSGNVIMSEGKTTVITVPSIPDVDTYTLGIPVPDLSTSEVQGALSFNTGAGSVTVPSDMLTGVTGISGARAQIAIGQGDKARLPGAVKAAIGDKPLIQLTLSIDGKQTNWNNPDTPVTVSIPYKPTAAELAHPESVVIWYIDGSGKVVSIPSGHYDPATGMVTFSTTHFSNYAVAYNPVSFNDVPVNAWYSKAVSFIAARGITSGTGNGRYSPEAKLTRGEFIVMMMRAYSIAPDENPSDNFSDAGSTYYTGYLAAAKRLGISEGVGNNMYAPGNRITRQEMFTLLYNTLKVIGRLPRMHGRAVGEADDQPRMHGRAVSEADDQPQGDSGKTLSDFSDAGEINVWAREAMTTFVVTGTVGGDSGKLTPTGTTTRAEMAQVLYNLLGK